VVLCTIFRRCLQRSHYIGPRKVMSDPNLVTSWPSSAPREAARHVARRHPALFSGGELNAIWEHGYVKRQPCSCGEPIQRCESWSKATARAFGSASQPDPAPHQVADEQRHTRWIARSVRSDPDLAHDWKLHNYRLTLLPLYQTTYSRTILPDVLTAVCNVIGRRVSSLKQTVWRRPSENRN
jgi:hypothetical protein